MSPHTVTEYGTADAAVAAEFLAAYGAHDWERLERLMAEDVTWDLPGRAVISGTARGREAVIDRVKHIVAAGIATELVDVRTGQTGIALDLRNRAERGGLVLDERLVTLLRLDGDRIWAIETYLSDVPMMEAFFGPAD